MKDTNVIITNAKHLADNLQNTASVTNYSFSGMLWDSAAMIRVLCDKLQDMQDMQDLHTENTALRATEYALRDEIAELEKQLESIRRTGSLGSVDSWLALSDQQKRDWFAVTLTRDAQQIETIKQLEEDLEAVRKLVRAEVLEEAAKEFDRRSTYQDGSISSGFYEPDEPAQIRRSLKEQK